MYPLGMIPKKRVDVDNRDLKYSTLFKVNRTARKIELDVRTQMSQGSFGTCTAFAACNAIDRLFRQITSRLYLYANTKANDGYPDTDGSSVDETLKALMREGIVAEELFEYSLYKEKLIFPPISGSLRAEGRKNKIDMYVKIETPEELADHLLHDNMAIMGATVGLGSFFNPEHWWNGDAIVNMPAGTIAGHAMAVVGIDFDMEWTYRNGVRRKGFVKIAQSWGTEDRVNEFDGTITKAWTRTGYGWIPFDYMFGGFDMTGGGSFAKYVTEIFVPLKDVPFTIVKIDAGNQNIKPYIKNDRTMVPLRFIGESLEMNVFYNEDTRGIRIHKLGHSVELTIGDNTMLVNGKPIRLDAVPEIVGNRTFVPLRAVAEAFRCEVEYFNSERRIEIKAGSQILELWIGRNEARRIQRV